MLHYKLNKYKEWWNNLAQREQRLLLIGSISLTLFMIYIFFWSPLSAASELMRQRISKNEKLVVWMQAVNQEINELTQFKSADKNKSYSPVEMISVLQNQINRAHLQDQLTQIKQTGNDAIEIHFQKVNFDKLSAMLIKLSETQNITITQIAVKATNSSGFVSADVTLK